jgi:hypothetical protein
LIYDWLLQLLMLNGTHAPDDLLTNGMAAKTLHALLPERSEEQWALWLQNNRNHARPVSYRVPFVRMGGGVLYEVAELNRFVEWERARKLGTVKLSSQAAAALDAFGIGTSEGSPYGRSLSCKVDVAQTQEGEPFVRLIVEKPLAVFRLSAAQASSIAHGLIESADLVARADQART